MDIEEAIKRIKYLKEDECNCPECIKNKEVYGVVLNYIKELKTELLLEQTALENLKQNSASKKVIGE